MLNGVRRLHLYFGVFFAPSILFFAFTGALQTFGLHEGGKGESYTPPAWIVQLARVHKDQRLENHPRKPPSRVSSPTPQTHEHPDEDSRIPWLKWFVLTMATGLITTTLMGIYMAFAYHRNRTLLWGLLLTGALLPALLLFA
jgi:hypothetical protein